MKLPLTLLLTIHTWFRRILCLERRVKTRLRAAILEYLYETHTSPTPDVFDVELFSIMAPTCNSVYQGLPHLPPVTEKLLHYPEKRQTMWIKAFDLARVRVENISIDWSTQTIWTTYTLRARHKDNFAFETAQLPLLDEHHSVRDFRFGLTLTLSNGRIIKKHEFRII